MSDKLVVLEEDQDNKAKFPSWLRQKLPEGDKFYNTDDILSKYRLNTVCMEAKCPNRAYCYERKSATFLVLGKVCTRACGFCEIDFDKNPLLPEEDEGIRVAHSVKELGLRHVVITVVARDDLPHQGAPQLAKILDRVKEINPEVTIEILTSDFLGIQESIDIVLDTGHIDIFNHNIETIRRLTPSVRHKATYDRSFEVLKHAKSSTKVSFVKSGLMVGLGESVEEVKSTLDELMAIDIDIVTIGQYLQPSRKKLVVKEFVSPETFEIYENYGKQIGIGHIYSGPFVRSSFNAEQVFLSINK